jgi:eukaryotic-like serine/threonine-protein kinase
MGEVYLARDETLGRRVALKFLSPARVADEEFLKRFETEARAASALNHPNILTIFEIGKIDGRSYIATEFIEGETLRRKITDGKLNFLETVKIAAQIAQALEAAHQAGIVHRDVKPENIMIRRDGYAKILDFGLAKSIGQNLAGESKNFSTLPGVVPGTPNYMSPEQIRGQKVDARTDIFSFGIVLYEMISRRNPFADGSANAVVASILLDEPPDLRELAPDVPAEFVEIVGKTLRKNKNERYQTMNELLGDLRNLRGRFEDDSSENQSSGNPFFYKSINQKSPVFAFLQNRKTLAAAAVLLIMLISAAFYFFAPGRSEKINSVAVLPFAGAGGETEYLADGLTESIIERLSKLPGFKVMSFNSVSRYKGKDADAQTVGRELKVEAVLISRLAQNGDDVSINTELVSAADNSRIWGFRRSGKASDILAMQESISKEISERLNLELSGANKNQFEKRYTQNPEAFQLYLKGRFFWNKRSAEDLRRGIEFFNQAIEKDAGFALAYAGLADCYGLLANYADAPPQETMPRAKAAALRALEIDDNLAEAHTSLGLVKKEYEWDFAGAEASFRRAIELNPNYATAHQWRAENLVVLGKFDEAIESMRRAQQVDPFSLIINGEVGWALHHARRPDEAVAQLEKTVELDRNFARTHFFLGRAFEQKKMYKEAIAAANKAIEISGDNALFKASLAHIYARAGQTAEAEEILRKLNEKAKTEYVSPFAFALIYAGTDAKVDSLDWLEKAYQRRDTILYNYIRDPQLDNLRGEPRFIELLNRVRLEP